MEVVKIFENHVKEVSYVLSSVILVIFGDTIIDRWAVPWITEFIGVPSIGNAILGTLLFIIWCVLGVTFITWLLNENIIDKSNVNKIAIISFIILVVFLGTKYGWM